MTNDLVDCKQLIQSYQIGHVIDNYSDKGINQAIDEMLQMDFNALKIQLQKAKLTLNWEKEEIALKDLYAEIINQ